MTTPLSPEWNSVTKRTVALLGLLFIVVLAWRIRTIFPLVIVSGLIAYIMNPLVSFLTLRVFVTRTDNVNSRRGLATIVSFFIALVALVILLLVVVPEIIVQVTEFGRSIPGWLETFETDAETWLGKPILFNGEPILINDQPFVPLDRIEEATGTRDLNKLFLLDELDLGRTVSAFFNSARNLSGPAFSFLGGAFNTLISTTFLLIMTFYLLKDGGKFATALVDLAPADYQEDVSHVLEDIAAVWDAYLRGQLILSVVIGVAVYFAATLLGLPNAIMLGLISGLLEFIPNLGPLIALIPAAFLALVSQSMTIPVLSGVPFMLVVIIVWTVLQNIEAVFLVPRIIGDSLDLHPFIVIISVMSGAAVAGALGVILAAPFVASGRVIARYVYGKISGRPPFHIPDEAAKKVPPTLVVRIIRRGWDILTARLREGRSPQDAVAE